jgi:hypothetical protein
VVDNYLTSQEQRKDRLAHCNSCVRLNIIRQCKECLCFVDLKTMLKSEHCPIGKWKEIEK